MDEARARSLVRETFQQGFDRGRYERFLRELLNRFEDKPLKYQGQYIPDAFKEHVSSLGRIGTYAAPGGERVDLLVIHLTKRSTLGRARTSLRNYVAHHLKTRDAKDAALVAFVSPSESTWRFSYVRMEYATVTDARGRVGLKTDLTPARRLSYLVGEGESCHTAQSRFLAILQRTAHDPSIEELEAAFSVEAVTKEFFEEYKALLLNLTERLDAIAAGDKAVAHEFSQRKINTVDFAKKLMGQIVFLYFVQKKGWLGVGKGAAWGSGPQDFIRRLAAGDFGVRGNIFNDILEPLFYDTLAVNRGPDAWCSHFSCRIPFLNGGLFEPIGGYAWSQTDIAIPDAFFTNAETTRAGDVGTGILDVFDRYNFTVNEAEPLEVEVAIDPEMLGKVFERLLDVDERKAKGSFYTPREIVHYMCQQSLLNYLDRRLNGDPAPVLLKRKLVEPDLFGAPPPRQVEDQARRALVARADLELFITSGERASHYEAARLDGTGYRRELPRSIQDNAAAIDLALAEITVCDPAIGSGAFPVGMMTEIVRARTTLTSYLALPQSRTAYSLKLHAVRNSIYGVDTDEGAVEIAKLRIWLSLVVDEEDVKTINPLPNLDYHVVAGNSLLGFPYQSEGLYRIEELKGRLFSTTDHDEKIALKRLIADLLSERLKGSRKALGYAIEFDFRLFFSEVFARSNGFDVVVANPPYLSAIEFSRNHSEAERKRLTERYRSAKGAYDIFVLFIEQGLNLLNARGTLAYINPNKYLSAPYASALREEIVRRAELWQLVDTSGLRIFEDASVYPVVSFMSPRSRDGYQVVVGQPTERRYESFDLRRMNFIQIHSSL